MDTLRPLRDVVSAALKRVGLVLALVAGLTAAAHAASDCPAIPAAIKDLDIPRFYADADGSVVDERLDEAHKLAVEPLTEFLKQVVSDADHAVTRRNDKSRAEAADCALAWLESWAAGGAWLGTMSTKQAEYQRKWDLGGAALAYLKVRRFATPDQRRTIEPWLQSFADVARAFFDDPERKRNNHWYWLGLGEAAVGLATESPRHLDIARGIMQDALRDIAPDGSLPEEMARKGRALHYHGFAVTPLVMMAELAASRGEDWYAFENGALHRLVTFTLSGLQSPEKMDALVGVAQERPINGHAGWLHVYRRRFPDRVTGTLPKVSEGHRWLGGNSIVLLDVLKRKD